MCGIFGIWQQPQQPINLTAVQQATQAQQHRGPDDEGYLLFNTASRCVVHAGGPDSDPKLNLPLLTHFADKNFDLALGFRRLAILDLSPAGHQPMTTPDGRYWIVYNGEIYNYLELKQELLGYGHRFHSDGDTNVILAAYAQWGPNCLQRLNGMWALAILDVKEQKLFCARDRMGIKPFHYFFDGQHFAFGSEIKPLLALPFVPRKINERAAYEYLAYGAVEHSAETFFAEIMHLLPGHWLTLDLNSGTLNIQQYYQPNLQIDQQLTAADAASEFRRLLTDSVRIHLRSDVAVGSCLSGGLDSSALVCLMHQLLGETGQREIQHTFSSHFEDKEANELEYMQTVIQATGVQAHFTYPKATDLLDDLARLVWYQEEPFGSTSIFAQWSVFKLVHEHGIKVMLDGQGPDELMGGYIPLTRYFFRELRAQGQYFTLLKELWQHKHLYDRPWSELIPNPMQFLKYQILGKRQTNPASTGLAWIAPRLTQAYAGQSVFQQNEQQKPFVSTEHFRNVLYQLSFANNLQALLKYEDRNSMAFSVESRVPYLDHRLVEFIFRLPSALKVHNGYTKWIMRDALGGVLPEKIRWRTGKLGFATPERIWQRSILQPCIEQALQDERLRQFIVPESALAYWQTHLQSDRQDYTPWRWVNLSLWMKAYHL